MVFDTHWSIEHVAHQVSSICHILGDFIGCWVQGFLVQLRQDDDEASQLEALTQLNELLSISNEESLSVFPVEQLVPVLVRARQQCLLHACGVALPGCQSCMRDLCAGLGKTTSCTEALRCLVVIG